MKPDTRTTYQQEFISDVDAEIRPLLETHWQEIALNKDRVKLNPNWDAYYDLEAVGKMKVFTARKSGELIGYFVVVVDRHIHYKDHLFATNDILYLSPEYRKGFTGIKLIKFAEKCLKEDGVSVLIINTKVHKPFDKLMEFLKFNNIERVYSKYIGK